VTLAMATLYLTHDACLAHDTGPGHPERPDRLRAIERHLAAPEFAALTRELAPVADAGAVARVHGMDYVDAIREAEPAEGAERIHLDGDTLIAHGSYEAAMRAVGGTIRAVDAVMAGEATNAFVATRPPGHHAERRRPMGFCLFSTAAIAAMHAQAAHGVTRVAVVDFDVHHGNGTQDVFWDQPNLFYASSHQAPFYPGTGAVSETGAHGTICNAPLRAGDGGAAFKAAYTGRILPELRKFRPDLLILSAGFDAHHDDPLGGLGLDEDDFTWITEVLLAEAETHCGGRVVSVLEGGYDLNALGRSAAAHVRALMGAAS
jgi:acetoin utilization deacetylase AcuC-like enzyme